MLYHRRNRHCHPNHDETSIRKEVCWMLYRESTQAREIREMLAFLNWHLLVQGLARTVPIFMFLKQIQTWFVMKTYNNNGFSLFPSIVSLSLCFQCGFASWQRCSVFSVILEILLVHSHVSGGDIITLKAVRLSSAMNTSLSSNFGYSEQKWTDHT